jgi:tetratricopeptide (TPR) repeat protein
MYRNYQTRTFILSSIFLGLLTQGCTFQEQGVTRTMKEAYDLVLAQKFSDAESLYKQIIVSEKNSIYALQAQLDLARCYLKEKNYFAAIETSKQALVLCKRLYGEDDSLEASILYTRATAEEGAKQYEAALKTCNEILEFEKHFPDRKMARTILPLINIASIQAKQGNFAAAIDSYEKLRAQSDLPTFVNLKLAICYEKVGLNEKADAVYRQILPQAKESDLAEGSDQVFLAYVQFLKKLGREEEIARIEKQRAAWNENAKLYGAWNLKRTARASRFRMMKTFAQDDLRDAMSIN